MSKNTAFVIVPNWNGILLISDCLESLINQTSKLEIVVVDNGSVDDSVNKVKHDFPNVKIIELTENTGFTGGVNAGIEYALDKKAEFILLFNNDATADIHWAEYLVTTAIENPKAGIVTCKFLRTDKKHIDSVGEFYTIWGLPFPRGRNQLDQGQYDETEEVFGASGGASLYRAEMLKQIGLFDEDYFAYYEDVDISFRAQLNGWKILYQPNAVAFHQVGATSSRLGDFARFHSAKNFLLLYARNMPLKLYIKYLPLFTLQFLRMAASSIVRRKFIVFLKGTFAAFKLHSCTIRERHSRKNLQTVSVKYVDSILTHSRPPKIPRL